eukprot:TRINITY_DN20717_c0_g1_i3.p1 TRINITY_DN20717_c0_g1~~TRINITY_DN20717_c0_g1_i3.p1  ORF type:complete len:187 (+),score=-9.36 TRINITY_DN20717_c0_g1_i3:101-661(+)
MICKKIIKQQTQKFMLYFINKIIRIFKIFKNFCGQYLDLIEQKIADFLNCQLPFFSKKIDRIQYFFFFGLRIIIDKSTKSCQFFKQTQNFKKIQLKILLLPLKLFFLHCFQLAKFIFCAFQSCFLGNASDRYQYKFNIIILCVQNINTYQLGTMGYQIQVRSITIGVLKLLQKQKILQNIQKKAYF